MKLSSQFGETEDEVMGTALPQGEGDTWELNRESLWRLRLQINGFHIAPEKLRSEGRLTSVTRAEGGEAEFLVIDVTVIGEGISPELPQRLRDEVRDADEHDQPTIPNRP